MRFRILALVATLPAAFLLRCVEDKGGAVPRPTLDIPVAAASMAPPEPPRWTCSEAARQEAERRLRTLPRDFLQGRATIEVTRTHVRGPYREQQQPGTFDEVKLQTVGGVPQALHLRGTATLLSAAHCGADDVWEDAPPTTKAVRLTNADLAPLFSALTQSTLRRAQPSDAVEYLGRSVVRIQFAENAAIELYRYPGVGWVARVAGCGELIGNDPSLIDLVLKVART